MKSKKPLKKKVREENEYIRLNKMIADSGIASRRKADELIESGAVTVNRKVVTELGTKVSPTDTISVNGDIIRKEVKHIYILLNKPKDCITTTSDEKDRKTVMDIVRKRERIYPVGRLDRNTTGALLLTNDGDLSHRLTHPSYQIEREYTATLDKPIKTSDARHLSEGVELEDGMTSPCEILIDVKDNAKVSLKLKEGRNHEVKRMFEALGYNVTKLDRKSFAGLSTKGLVRGEYRNLTNSEVQYLKKIVKLR